ncbi:MAG: tRNA (adenosine(37)-N6)-dimethylallyltransferase MiaA [Calditrichaeota bacterium]|nr:tRNA (adenosine(37)-N6)-dimethylallyltransferase MiaA [Calditrichota bacterium]MCB0286625.1 tRNA (adenosine(37)-N6)-dimethylallyltransferase MiaA [Calditrichota bacterium]MCB9066943.1 tRNA (adenosine(37)-N6)-dimethylallyltransferase MiaA [Calditrichia bacterium]
MNASKFQISNFKFPENTVLVICGPTGIGKTALSLAVADAVPAEIVSADSRQIYKYMDIGTAKPTAAEQAVAPHHFIDILEPDVDYSAGEYSRDARETVAEIFDRGKLPVVAGGSGLYIRALLDGFFNLDAKDEQLREKLNKRLANEGIEKLFAEFATIDPELASKTHPNSIKRVLRALEVYHITGKPMSQIQQENRDPAPFGWIKIALTMERKSLYARINQRVEEMFDLGLVDEVRSLLDRGFSANLNAMNSVGYKEVVAYLNGEIDLFTCKELVKQNSRRYAKRQFTWFRGESDVHWLEISPEMGKADARDGLFKKLLRIA